MRRVHALRYDVVVMWNHQGIQTRATASRRSPRACSTLRAATTRSDPREENTSHHSAKRRVAAGRKTSWQAKRLTASGPSCLGAALLGIGTILCALGCKDNGKVEGASSPGSLLTLAEKDLGGVPKGQGAKDQARREITYSCTLGEEHAEFEVVAASQFVGTESGFLSLKLELSNGSGCAVELNHQPTSVSAKASHPHPAVTLQRIRMGEFVYSVARFAIAYRCPEWGGTATIELQSDGIGDMHPSGRCSVTATRLLE